MFGEISPHEWGQKQDNVLRARLLTKINTALEKRLPERRLFLKSDSGTRFVRLTPATQALGLVGSMGVVAWTIIASSILFMHSIGAGSVRDQAQREQYIYEARLNALSQERDHRTQEAVAAQERFSAALTQISAMQSELLALEDRRFELETGVGVIQSTLRTTIKQRDTARANHAALQEEIALGEDARPAAEGSTDDLIGTLDFLTAALNGAADERDQIEKSAAQAFTTVADMEYEAKLVRQRNDRIFNQLEEAVSVSLAPMDKMFRDAGMSPDRMIEQIRRGYNGQGGPLTPLALSTKGERPDADSLRANGILRSMDDINIYRIAAAKAPFALPVKSAFRFTSGFGPRWGRMHNGTDFAAAHGTPIYTTGDGVVIHAGRLSGFGNLVKVQHEFGIVTFYAHMSKIRVAKGQRVSRGDRIGDMGNTGRSTGTHLHYEVRVGGKPVNPMKFIKAARDVF
jgi:murein DD-endopeptidase MepM/ murein hydrolase activator NlpD